MDRRRFLQSLAVAAACPALQLSVRAEGSQLGPLRSDPDKILDLPDGFSYKVVSRFGDQMSDGLQVPYAHDGMAAFPGDDGRVILICNHEIGPDNFHRSGLGRSFAALPHGVKEKFYDAGRRKTPGTGGTTTTIYNPSTGETERQHRSLAGTEINCAGGPTPWGSWLSCEECFESPGRGIGAGRILHREKPHGYVFEVSAYEEGLVEPHPIKAMGRFIHEAAAVHQTSGIIYMTEDELYSLFYRFIPDVPGKLLAGGRLQALVIDGQPSMETHNWSESPTLRPGAATPTRWIDLDDINPDENDLRLRGAASGAATFARGEGLCVAGDEFAFTCTIGGPARLGQVFSYRPSPFEGTPHELEIPGKLTLLAEATTESLLRNADNLTMAPWGDLIVCEDTASQCGLVGIRADGKQYQLASNCHTTSELAGVCFSPDGQTLFVNIQYPGMTLAITGPFPA